MNCKRCGNVPQSPVRQLGDDRYPSTFLNYCLDCVFAIIREWEAAQP